MEIIAETREFGCARMRTKKIEASRSSTNVALGDNCSIVYKIDQIQVPNARNMPFLGQI